MAARWDYSSWELETDMGVEMKAGEKRPEGGQARQALNLRLAGSDSHPQSSTSYSRCLFHTHHH